MTLSVGIDIGGTNIRAALVDADGTIVHAQRTKLEGRKPDDVVATIIDLHRELGPDAAYCPIGVGIAGSVRDADGVVSVAPQLGWREEPFGAMLSSALARNSTLRLRLVNDLTAIAYGEFKLGAGRGSDDVACLFVGTGVGLGIVVGGRVLEGSRGLAPEFGHWRVDPSPHARRCNCGMYGCLEAYLAGAHLGARVTELCDELETSTSLAPPDVSAGDIEAAARAGDRVASALQRDMAEKLAWAMGAVVMTFNPAVLVLGGGVLTSSPSLTYEARSRVHEYAWSSFLEDLVIAPTQLADDAGIIGAALLSAAQSTS